MYEIDVTVSSNDALADPPHVGADPDPTFHFDAGPDPTVTLLRIRIQIQSLIKVRQISAQVYRPSTAPFGASTPLL